MTLRIIIAEDVVRHCCRNRLSSLAKVGVNLGTVSGLDPCEQRDSKLAELQNTAQCKRSAGRRGLPSISTSVAGL